jgi:hypothetical protein
MGSFVIYVPYYIGIISLVSTIQNLVFGTHLSTIIKIRYRQSLTLLTSVSLHFNTLQIPIGKHVYGFVYAKIKKIPSFF